MGEGDRPKPGKGSKRGREKRWPFLGPMVDQQDDNGKWLRTE
jgi:hypothetical protein